MSVIAMRGPGVVAMPVRRPLHVVQISRDRALLGQDLRSEPVQRQLDYARELRRRVPGSTVTIIVVGRPAGSAGGWRHENLGVVPASGAVRGTIQCARILNRLHHASPISVITTQVPYDEAWIALVLGRMHGIPVVAQIHSDLFAEHPSAQRTRRFVHRAHQWLTRRTLRAFAAVRTVSSEARASVATLARNVVLATIPVPVPMLTAARHAVSPRLKQPLVVFVGRLAAEKDLTTWLEVAAVVTRRVPGARFEIVGDGVERARLEREARRLGLGDVLRFTGFLTYDQLQDVYARASVLLLTSRHEGFGRVLVEAASQGTAAVSTSLAGPRDIIVHGVTGYLHEPGDVDGLARSVARLLQDPQRASGMGERARTLVTAKFDPRRLRAAWVDLWVRAATGQCA